MSTHAKVLSSKKSGLGATVELKHRLLFVVGALIVYRLAGR